MGCNTSKSARTYNSMTGSKNQQKPQPMWYTNSEWDSVTDSQTASTYLDRTGASTCSLRRDGTEKGSRGIGDGMSAPDCQQESTGSEEAQGKPPSE